MISEDSICFTETIEYDVGSTFLQKKPSQKKASPAKVTD